ncbi:HAD-IC family P-type ATPase [Pannonibacter sp. Pt2]|uniref:HAD-IC family P-type ATPase n=1 Tax=Pannonibacter anstelovis TaxID=3121537 RepID=A0ABU7ZJ63_9HYPH
MSTQEATFHDQPPGNALAWFASSPEGLSSPEAAERLAQHGRNELPPPPRRHPAVRFLRQFHNVLIYVLLAAGAVSAGLGHHVDALVILLVVVINAVIGFVQEGKAEAALEALRKMLASHTPVLRDGSRQMIASALLVPGDIVLLEAGERVPADLRILSAHGLRTDEALLTGEAVPADKLPDAVAPAAPLAERSSMAFSGTLVTAGSGTGVVVATGQATEIGHINRLMSRVRELKTPLTEQMDRFARGLTLVILAAATLLLLHGMLLGGLPFSELFMVVVGLSVSAIPEGLPAVLTITLAAGAKAMANRHAIVRHLPAIETMGAVSVICTDKTGTLTCNEMMVVRAITACNAYEVSGSGYAPNGEVRSREPALQTHGGNALAELALAASLCNDAALRYGDGAWHAEGDPMEAALKAFAGKVQARPEDSRQGWRRTGCIPFDAAHRYMAVLNRSGTGDTVIHVKGAPEELLAMCTLERGPDGTARPLDRAAWHRRIASLSAEGQRVLGFAAGATADGLSSLQHHHLREGLVFIGLLGLIDPPRPEAIAAVAQCHQAGIAVKMITGDHAGTASAIAREIGLREPQNVLTGAEIDALSDAELAGSLVHTNVFARTSPEHKLRLVTALQSMGHTVAMTGDGVNDAPALKRADVGIAMGNKGSEAAREAAALVLTDDNFASIAAAVSEGRTVYDNIRKVISWTLPTNAGEGLTIICALLFGMALPVTAVQILWVNLITATTLGLALAFELAEDNTMRRPPRRRSEPLMGLELLWHIAMVSLLFLCAVFGIYAYATDKGHPPELARTLALNMLVVLEIFHLFFIRNIHGTSFTWKAAMGTPAVWICVAIATTAQFAITYLPPMQRAFGTVAIPFADGLLVVVAGVLFFILIEIEKQIRLSLKAAALG